jgi:glycosyltransferase involved in cell wall biosynthesis
VIATRWGAAPEVIEHGRSGVIVDDYTEMADALPDADRLEPLECREWVEEHFSATRMVEDYLEAYEAVLARAPA